MTIKTWSSFSKRRNSTKQPTGGTDRTVTLKHPTSIIRPVFLIQTFSLSDNYLKWNDRYYFIDDIVVVNDSMAEYHCTVDALASWKTQIGGLTEFVTRSASSYDLSLIDGLYPMKEGVGLVTSTPISDFNLTEETGIYVVGIICGENTASGSITYYAFTAAQFADFCAFLFDASGPYLDTAEVDLSMATQKELVNPFQYIVSCTWFPVNTWGDAVTHVKFGWWDWTPGSGFVAKILRSTDRNVRMFTSNGVTLPTHAEAATRGSYLNGAPFTRRTLYCFSYGQIPLDPSFFVTVPTIYLELNVDMFTGGSKLSIFNFDGDMIAQYHAQFGVQIQIAQMSQQVEAPVMTAIGTVGSLFSMNFAGAASSIVNGVHNMMPQLVSSGSTGSNVDYLAVPRIVSEFRYQSAMDATQNGRPLCQQKTINTLSGYIKTENADVDLPCTQEERDQIASYMNGGFFYE